jgi:hypothetical protein
MILFTVSIVALIWVIIGLAYSDQKKKRKEMIYLADKIIKYHEYEQYHGPTTFKIPMEQLLEDFVHES